MLMLISAKFARIDFVPVFIEAAVHLRRNINLSVVVLTRIDPNMDTSLIGVTMNKSGCVRVRKSFLKPFICHLFGFVSFNVKCGRRN
jgi:hypothetical protein